MTSLGNTQPTSHEPACPVELPSFEMLVADTSSDLYRLAMRSTGDRAEADDVLQTTYVPKLVAGGLPCTQPLVQYYEAG